MNRSHVWILTFSGAKVVELQFSVERNDFLMELKIWTCATVLVPVALGFATPLLNSVFSRIMELHLLLQILQFCSWVPKRDFGYPECTYILKDINASIAFAVKLYHFLDDITATLILSDASTKLAASVRFYSHNWSTSSSSCMSAAISTRFDLVSNVCLSSPFILSGHFLPNPTVIP